VSTLNIDTGCVPTGVTFGKGVLSAYTASFYSIISPLSNEVGCSYIYYISSPTLRVMVATRSSLFLKQFGNN